MNNVCGKSMYYKHERVFNVFIIILMMMKITHILLFRSLMHLPFPFVRASKQRRVINICEEKHLNTQHIIVARTQTNPGHKHQSNAKRMETILRGGASFLFIRWIVADTTFTRIQSHISWASAWTNTHRTENQPCQLIAWNAWHFVTFDDLTRMWWFYTKTSPFFLLYTLIHFLSISLFLSPFFPWLLTISLLYLYLVCTAFVCTPIVIGYNTFYMLELEYNGNSFQP